MKCKNCGGELKYRDGILVCQSCSAKFQPSEYYEKIDVFIAYIENNENGRRSKDSIIAQEIYQNLEANNISTFYARISADSLVDEEYKNAINQAIHYSKTILIVGTNKYNFEMLLEDYQEYFDGRTVIPVISDITPNSLPEELKSIQSLDYNKVGAKADLLNSILKSLGRSAEFDFNALSKKRLSKKKKAVIITCIVLMIALVATAGYLVFGTTLVLPEKKYEYAVSCYKDGKYNEALNCFYALGDYKDSQLHISNIYEKYTGYYYDENSAVSFHLTIKEGNSAYVEIKKVVEGSGIITITETSVVQCDTLEVKFTDSWNNHGAVSVKFNDDSLNLTVLTTEKTDETVFMDENIVFNVSDRKDKPSNTITKELLIKWIESKATIGQIKKDGFEVISNGPLYRSDEESEFQIKNTNIKLAGITYDFAKYNACVDYDYDDVKYVNDPIVYGISAPVEIVAPELVGKTGGMFVNGDFVYLINADLGLFVWSSGAVSDQNHTVDALDSVVIISKKAVGEEYFNIICSEMDDYNNRLKEENDESSEPTENNAENTESNENSESENTTQETGNLVENVYGIVIGKSETVTVYSGWATEIYQIQTGTRVHIKESLLDTQGRVWYKIAYDGENYGWIYSKNVELETA